MVSQVFLGKKRKSRSHIYHIIVRFRRKKQNMKSIVADFWYSVDGVWDKREGRQQEEEVLYIARLVRTKAVMEFFHVAFRGADALDILGLCTSFWLVSHMRWNFTSFEREKRKTCLG